MSDFLYEVDDEKFEELGKRRFSDNKNVVTYLQELLDKGDDRRFNFTILNLGEVMKICAIELNLKANEIESYLMLEKNKMRDRRMNTIVKELNEKLNLRFNFEEDTEIVSHLYTYKGVGYIYINKTKFCSLLNDFDIDIDTLSNL